MLLSTFSSSRKTNFSHRIPFFLLQYKRKLWWTKPTLDYICWSLPAFVSLFFQISIVQMNLWRQLRIASTRIFVSPQHRQHPFHLNIFLVSTKNIAWRMISTKIDFGKVFSMIFSKGIHNVAPHRFTLCEEKDRMTSFNTLVLLRSRPLKIPLCKRIFLLSNKRSLNRLQSIPLDKVMERRDAGHADGTFTESRQWFASHFAGNNLTERFTTGDIWFGKAKHDIAANHRRETNLKLSQWIESTTIDEWEKREAPFIHHRRKKNLLNVINRRTRWETKLFLFARLDHIHRMTWVASLIMIGFVTEKIESEDNGELLRKSSPEHHHLTLFRSTSMQRTGETRYRRATLLIHSFSGLISLMSNFSSSFTNRC